MDHWRVSKTLPSKTCKELGMEGMSNQVATNAMWQNIRRKEGGKCAGLKTRRVPSKNGGVSK